MDTPKVTLSDRILVATVLRFFPARVTPNQITIFRFFTVPFVVFLLFVEEYRLGIVLFAISAFTDALDGALARTTNRVTEWGKVYDPLADKLLIVLTALIIVPKHLNVWIVFFILLLEVILIGSAYYLKNQGAVEITANAWGKAKMICQSMGVGLLLLYVVTPIPGLVLIAELFLYAAIFLALVSLVTYGI